MASSEVIREAALYLEYFLNGMSECSIIGSYTVQFLEMRSFSVCLQASLANHLIQLVANMKGLLLKLDSSLVSLHHVGVQTENDQVCSLCSCHKSLSLDPPKHRLEMPPQEKTFEPPELVQLLTSTPLIELKQEITCVADSVAPGTSQYQESAVTDVELDMKQKGEGKEQYMCNDGRIDKCILASGLPSALEDNIDLDYVSAQDLGENSQAEILLDDLDESDGESPDKLMYSVYTMNQCGSLQLVSRVLTKASESCESLEEPVEQATIKINTLKEEEQEMEPEIEALTLREECQASGSVVKEEQIDVPSEMGCVEDKNMITLNKKSLARKVVASEESPGDTVINTDIVKLGPEDLEMKNYWCGLCEKELPSAGSLRIHLSRVHSQVKWCHTCTKAIGSEDEMFDHVRECHRDIPFICSTCGQSLRTNAAFQRHMDIHKGLRGSACEVCGQTFSRTEYYREHKRIHTGEKPYKCDTCDKSFSRSSNLNTHMRIHNTDEHIHTCDICQKSFTRRDKLKDHMIRHWQIKRYACRLCPKKYSEKRDLTRHLVKVHAGHASIDT